MPRVKLDLLTVVCLDDYAQLLQQAATVSKRFESGDINQIHIVLNEEGINVDTTAWGKHSDKVIVWPYEPTYNLRIEKNAHRVLVGDVIMPPGWYYQQALKLVMSAKSTADWVCVLDAKNLFVSNFDHDSLFADGKCRRKISTEYTKHEFYDSKCSIASYFGIDNDYQLVYPATSTPYYFNVHALKEMISCVESRQGADFHTFFLDNMIDGGRLKFTEFLFYSGYLQSVNSIDTYYTGESNSAHIYFPGDDFARQLFSARKLDNLFCVALHKRTLPKLSKMELKLWNAFLDEKDAKFD